MDDPYLAPSIALGLPNSDTIEGTIGAGVRGAEGVLQPAPRVGLGLTNRSRHSYPQLYASHSRTF